MQTSAKPAPTAIELSADPNHYIFRESVLILSGNVLVLDRNISVLNQTVLMATLISLVSNRNCAIVRPSIPISNVVVSVFTSSDRLSSEMDLVSGETRTWVRDDIQPSILR
jgi:hypothetical protein